MGAGVILNADLKDLSFSAVTIIISDEMTKTLAFSRKKFYRKSPT